jgi:NADH:ubiquinone oxidoreductase subunit 4 (subunit M)
MAASRQKWSVAITFLGKPDNAQTVIKHLTFRESLTLMPLVVLTVLLGLYPKPVLDMSAASVNSSTTITAPRKLP